METLEELTQAIMSDEQNKAFTEQGIKPLVYHSKNGTN